MLIEFLVSNFRSIRREQALSLRTTQSNECPDNYFTFHNEKETFDLLKSVIIYGANASGKSNLIKSLAALKRLILKDDLGATEPFKLHKDTIHSPTEFDITFIVNNIRYQYIVAATNKRIQAECLYQFPNGRIQVLFERYCNDDGYAWKLGDALKGQKAMWRESTRDDQLFLKKASDNNSEQLMPLVKYFTEKVKYINNSNDLNPGHTIKHLLGDNASSAITKYLKRADLGISHVEATEEPFDLKMLPDEMPDFLRNNLFDELQGKNMVNIFTYHESQTLGEVKFDLGEESTGTRKYFGLSGYWINALENGGVLIVDELQNNLHPKLVEYLTGMFNSTLSNPHNAQLIFTSHDTSLLAAPFKFRRDQIVFCEKTDTQETEVYSLSDFSVRKDKQNIAKDYLDGRFGGIPFIHVNED